MRGRGGIGADCAQFQSERGARHHDLHPDNGDEADDQSSIDRGAEEARQTIVDSQRASLRNRRRRIEKNQLY